MYSRLCELIALFPQMSQRSSSFRLVCGNCCIFTALHVFAFHGTLVTTLFNGCSRPILNADDGPWNWSETFCLANQIMA